jgi:hypothetical protein
MGSGHGAWGLGACNCKIPYGTSVQTESLEYLRSVGVMHCETFANPQILAASKWFSC